ncbi:MAG: hypothetical protein RL563_1080 [Pseudomonadota bacterium]|jgi:hypothetical protein
MATFTVRTEIDRDAVLAVVRESVLPQRIEVKAYKKNRSLAQNRLLHMWMKCLADHWHQSTGELFSPDAWKIQCKRQFLGEEVVELPGGKLLEQVRKTSELNTQEFTDFLEQIEIWAADDLECLLPRPDEYYEAMRYERIEENG